MLVLDLNMPGGGTSIDALPEFAERSPGTRVVVLTMQENPEYARQALRAGAGPTSSRKRRTRNWSKRSAAQPPARPIYTRPSARAWPPRPTESPDDLTDREAEVLRLIALGHTNTEISEKLFLSVRTVETHRAHVQQKLRLSTRAELVRYALDRGLLEGPER